MIPELFFLFILDFSGSMYQQVNSVPKYQLVQQNIQALMNSNINVASSSGVLTFGLDAKKGCEDLRYQDEPTRGVSQLVRTFRPGNFSKTPLAEAIKRGTDLTIERNVKRVIAFSDGADSCGKDPCQQLIASNEKLRRVNRVMEMTFIGIALKKDSAKFECFKKPMSNFKINFFEIGTSAQAQEILTSIPEAKPLPPKNPFGVLVVKGAPPGVEFSALPAPQDKSPAVWWGAYEHTMRQGTYAIKALYPKTKKVTTTVRSEDFTTLYWADFFSRPKATLKISNSEITVLLSPMEQTKQMHRNVQPILIEGSLIQTVRPQTISLPFGDWQLEILSPPWLKKLEKQFLSLGPDESKSFDLIKGFGLHFDAVSDLELRYVVETSNSNRFYIQKGVERIPLSSSDILKWVKSAP